MKRETSANWLCAIALTAMQPACAPGSVGNTDITLTTQRETVRAGRPTWGVVLGGITSDAGGGSVNTSSRPDAIACDLQQLGVGWVRIDVGTGDGDHSALRTFVRRLRDRGVHVLGLVHSRALPADANRDAIAPNGALQNWASAYTATIDRLIDDEFGGDIEAWEVGNEPNGEDPTFSRPPEPQAYLLARVWRDVRLASHPGGFTPIIVSGGVLDVRVDGAHCDGVPNSCHAYQWFEAFFASLSRLHDDAASPVRHTVPFDRFGIHPYNAREYNTGVDNIRPTPLPAYEAWRASVQADIGDLQARLRSIYGWTPVLWATEIGWTSSDRHPDGNGGTIPAPSSVPIARDNDEQANTFDLADQTLGGLVERAFWYVYRDDEVGPGWQNGVMGTRENSGGNYRIKALWTRMASRLAGGGDGNVCYANDSSPGTPPPATPPSMPTVPSDPGAYYLDVPTSDPDYTAIEDLRVAGIIRGPRYDEHYYEPETVIPRDQLAVVLARWRALPIAPPAQPSFYDVGVDFWAYGEIEAVRTAMLMRGFEDGSFGPSEQTLRLQLYTIIQRMDSGRVDYAFQGTANDDYPLRRRDLARVIYHYRH